MAASLLAFGPYQGASASIVYSSIREVGRPVTLVSHELVWAKTSLPHGVKAGDVAITYLETDRSAKVTCREGWRPLFDVANGFRTRFVACAAKIASNPAGPVLSVQPPSQVSMITMAFSGVTKTDPLSAWKARPGSVSPRVRGANGHVEVLFSEGIDLHSVQGVLTPVSFSSRGHLLGAAKNPPRSEVVIVTQPSTDGGLTPSWTWPQWDPGAADVSATIELTASWHRRPVKPANSTTTSTTSASTTSSTTTTTLPPTTTTTTLPPTTTTTTLPPTTTTTTTLPPTTTTTTTTTTSTTTTTTTDPPSGGGAPTSPPAEVCGNASILDGPSTAPANAVTVAAGNDSSLLVGSQLPPNVTYWFAPGTHTLGTSQYSQIQAGANDIFVGAPGAILSGQGDNDYAITAPSSATGVTVEYLTIEDFTPPGGNGAVNVNAESGWIVQNDTITENSPGAGLMIGTNNVIENNCLSDNGEYAFDAYTTNHVSSLTGGPSNITMIGNEITGNDTYNWESKNPGCGCSGGGKFWEVDGATVEDNYVYDNLNVGLWADTNNTGFTFTGNYISDNWNVGLMYEISYNAVMNDNTFVENGLGGGPTNPGFPTGAIYVSESGGDSRVPGPNSGVFQIEDNVFTNNWSGVVLWENSNRFCGSPDNTSSSNCTLVEPTVVNLSTCTQANLQNSSPSGNPDYYDMCRWKTQNITVEYNTFDLTASAIGTNCTSLNSCGQNGVFSEYCSNSSNGIGWSPYCGDSGYAISDAITKSQGNVFAHNTYNGPWTFDYGTQATDLSFSAWQADGEDAGSSA